MPCAAPVTIATLSLSRMPPPPRASGCFRGNALGVDRLANDPTHQQPGVIGLDVDEAALWIFQDSRLLQLQHITILAENGFGLLELFLRHRRVIDREVVRLRPEVMRRCFGFRRDAVEHADLISALPPAIERSVAGIDTT